MFAAKGAVAGMVMNLGQVAGLNRLERILFEESGSVDERGRVEEGVERVEVVVGGTENEAVQEEGEI